MASIVAIGCVCVSSWHEFVTRFCDVYICRAMRQMGSIVVIGCVCVSSWLNSQRQL